MISLRNVRAGYAPGEDVLRGISLDVESGGCLSVIGPNGCGKTTLLRVMAGILPFSGEILLDGESVREIKPKAMAKKAAMLSQITQVYFSYTVFDTVMMGRYAHGGGFLSGPGAADREAAEAALESAGVSADLRGRGIDALSGGQLQRVFLAKIFAQDPEVILLDEPTNHLDLSCQIDLINFLREWAGQRNKTVVGVLHDINLAMMFSDKIMLMDKGEVTAFGACAEVLKSPALNRAYGMDIPGFMLERLRKWEGF